MTLTDDERRLFNELIRAAGELATVADQASVVLSEQFEEMCRPQIDAVRAVLAQCPTAVDEFYSSDGNLREDDCDITAKKRRGDGYGQFSGVHILHRPTGLGMESDSKPSYEENKSVALKALTDRVRRELAKR